MAELKAYEGVYEQNWSSVVLFFLFINTFHNTVYKLNTVWNFRKKSRQHSLDRKRSAKIVQIQNRDHFDVVYLKLVIQVSSKLKLKR